MVTKWSALKLGLFGKKWSDHAEAQSSRRLDRSLDPRPCGAGFGVMFQTP
jgi:hypothetical protein